MSEVLQHGTRLNSENSSPALDRCWDFGDLRLHLIRPKKFEVNFVANFDTLTLPLGRLATEVSYDSDVVSSDGSVAGEINFHPKGSKTFCRTTDGVCELVAIDIDPNLRQSLFSDSRSPFPDETRVRLRASNTVKFVHALRQRLICGEPVQRIVAEAFAILAMDQVKLGVHGNEVVKAHLPSLSSQNLSSVLDIIEDDLSRDLSLSSLASEVGVSAYHFSRCFRESLGLSPHQYVLERRITRARELLENSSSPLADVAYAVGFSSQAHMTDVFRKRLGTTPGAYRKEFKS